jgi:sugar phosphate isomerase/epimerase
MVKAAGGDFIEEGVGGLLVPEAPEAEFLKKLEQLKAAPLPVPVCNGFIRRPDLKCVGPDANHDEVIKQVSVTFARAAKAGVKTIVFGSSGTRKVPAGWDPAKALDQFVAVLKRMAPIAADQGVTIAIEPLNAKECNFINRIGEVAEAAGRVGHPAVRGVADLYHMLLGGDTPDGLRKAMPFVHHVEIAEPKGRTLPPTNREDFTGFFRVLREAKFAGTMSMEGKWKDPDVAPAFAELRRQWAAAGT